MDGISEWHIYLRSFLSNIGVVDISNINVLDVGIGNSYASQILLKECANLIGVDISQRALNYAQDKLKSSTLKVGSAENLKDIESFSIDLYISLRTYQSTLFDIKESLHEAYRVLAKGGGIVISIPIYSKSYRQSLDAIELHNKGIAASAHRLDISFGTTANGAGLIVKF